MIPQIKPRLFLLLGLAMGGAYLSACSGSLSYRLEKISGPVGLAAVDQVTYTELVFYAYNVSTDFIGYQIATGSSGDAATANLPATIASDTITCPMTSNSTRDLPTRVQLGGTSNTTGAECHVSSIGPLTAGTWVSIVAAGSRDCSTYGDTCSNTSPVTTAEVLAYVAPPTGISIQFLTDYHLLEVTMTAVPASLNGIGLFYSPSENEAKYKATIDGSYYDGFCALTAAQVTAGVPVKIQIGGTLQAGMDCHITDFYLSTGDTIAVRNSVSRTKYPWSDVVTVVVP